MADLKVLSAPAGQQATISVARPQPQPSLKVTQAKPAPIAVKPLPPQPSLQVQAPQSQGKITRLGTADNPNQQEYVDPQSKAAIVSKVNSVRGQVPDNQILSTLIKQNQLVYPQKVAKLQNAVKQGYDPTQILDTFLQQNQSQEEPQDNGEAGLKGAALGFAKSYFSPLNTISNIGQSVLSQTAGRVANLVSGKGFSATPKALIDKENLKRQGTAENIGGAIGDISQFFLPGGAMSKAGKATDAAIEGLNLAGKTGKVATTALKLGARGALGAGEAAGITALQTGDKKATKQAAELGALFPVAETLIGAATNKIAPRMVNSLVKPAAKDFEFGKNPGASIVKEGITGNTWDKLIGNIRKVKSSVGEQIGKILDHPEVAKQSVNVGEAIKPVDDAILKAASRGDQQLVSALTDFKNGLTKEFGLVDGKVVELGSKPTQISPKEALALKGEIGDSVRWREGIDNEVNKVKVKTYQNVRNQMERAVNEARKVDSSIPDISKLNDRYANLTTAESSALHRQNVVRRLNLTSLGGGIVGSSLGGYEAAQDIKNKNYKHLPVDIALGAAGAFGGKALGSVAGKTYGAQVFSKTPSILRNAALGVNSAIANKAPLPQKPSVLGAQTTVPNLPLQQNQQTIQKLQGTSRADRHNNPTAMTTDTAKSMGLVEGRDYVRGDSFKDSKGHTLYTAKFNNDPVATTIKAIDNGGFYTGSGKARWSYLDKLPPQAISNWNNLSYDQKASVVMKMRQIENGTA